MYSTFYFYVCVRGILGNLQHNVEHFQVIGRGSPSSNRTNDNATCIIFPCTIQQQLDYVDGALQMRCTWHFLSACPPNHTFKTLKEKWDLQIAQVLSVWCFFSRFPVLPCWRDAWVTYSILTRNSVLHWGNCVSERCSLRHRCGCSFLIQLFSSHPL